MTDDEQQSPITAITVPDNERLNFLPKYFGVGMMHFENAVYSLARELSPDYKGGLWVFRTLSNGGAYMAPDTQRKFEMKSLNGWTGNLSADAMGIAITLFALSHLSFTEAFADQFAERYHQLREYAFDTHPEAANIIAMCD